MDIDKILELREDSFYLYNEDKLVKNFNSFLNSFKEFYCNVEIAYSYKTNYLPNLCKKIFHLGDIAEVVSEMELELALKLADNNRIIFNGPYKSEQSLIKSIENNVIIHIDNYDEFISILNILKNEKSKKCKIGLRINLSYSIDQVSRFGIDINDKDFKKILKIIQSNNQFHLVGIHCHLPNRDLKSFKFRIEKMLEIYESYFFDKIEYIDIGGGFPSELSKTLAKQLNLKIDNQIDYAKVVGETMNHFFNEKKIVKPKLIVEPGTAIVANVMDFFTKVIAEKKVGKKNILMVSGSKFNYVGLQTKNLNFPYKEYFIDRTSEKKIRKCDLGGYTCIESDYILKNIKTSLKKGDYISIEDIGSYSIVMKPPFILPNVPIFQIVDDTAKCIKRREDTDDIFNTYLTYE